MRHAPEPEAETTAAEGGLGNEIAGDPAEIAETTIREASTSNLLARE